MGSLVCVVEQTTPPPTFITQSKRGGNATPELAPPRTIQTWNIHHLLFEARMHYSVLLPYEIDLPMGNCQLNQVWAGSSIGSGVGSTIGV